MAFVDASGVTLWKQTCSRLNSITLGTTFNDGTPSTHLDWLLPCAAIAARDFATFGADASALRAAHAQTTRDKIQLPKAMRGPPLMYFSHGARFTDVGRPRS